MRSIYRVGFSALAFACSDSPTKPLPPAGDGTFSAAFTGAFDVITSGWSWVEPQPLQDPLITLRPIDLNGNLEIYLFQRGGFLPSGDYPIGHWSDPSTKVYVRIVRELIGGSTGWESISGTVHLDASSTRGVIGTATLTATVSTQPPLQANLTFSAKELK
jgi:hypothetical protein